MYFYSTRYRNMICMINITRPMVTLLVFANAANRAAPFYIDYELQTTLHAFVSNIMSHHEVHVGLHSFFHSAPK